MTQKLKDLVDQFCQYQRKQRGMTDGGVKTFRWNLSQFLEHVRGRTGRLARVQDVTQEMIQARMDEMAASDLAINTLRCRQASLSSFCNWLVKRTMLDSNPVCPDGSAAPPVDAALGPKPGGDECSHPRREGPGVSARRGALSPPAVHENAAGIRGDAPHRPA